MLFELQADIKNAAAINTRIVVSSDKFDANIRHFFGFANFFAKKFEIFSTFVEILPFEN